MIPKIVQDEIDRFMDYEEEAVYVIEKRNGEELKLGEFVVFPNCLEQESGVNSTVWLMHNIEKVKTFKHVISEMAYCDIYKKHNPDEPAYILYWRCGKPGFPELDCFYWWEL